MDGLADWGMIESWDMWMVSGGFQVLGSFNAPEMGQGACQLDGGSRVWRWGISSIWEIFSLGGGYKGMGVPKTASGMSGRGPGRRMVVL